MLEYLRIRNLALIEDAELDFAPGMNVLTGETGAGKSFILKALGFLLGDRLGADMVRQGAEKAQVEAQFQMDGREIVIRRSLLAESGRPADALEPHFTCPKCQDTGAACTLMMPCAPRNACVPCGNSCWPMPASTDSSSCCSLPSRPGSWKAP